MFKSLNAIQSAIVEVGITRPKLVLVGALIVTIVLLVALVLRVTVDTDPENMLSSSHPVRVLNNSIAEEFGAKNMLVLGIVDDEGVLNPGTLANAARLVEDIKALDRVESEGVISFASITAVPEGDLSEADVDRIAADIVGNPLLGNRVISEDVMALAIYIPLKEKGDVNGAAAEVDGLVSVHTLAGDGGHFLAGLPLAEEKFGRDMFIQMALLAPLAGMLIFLLMLYFFRKLVLVVAAMLVAMLSVVWTMGLLTGTGFTLHIMSSMIPIFLMPIAVLDSIHILSEFFEHYPQTQDRSTTLRLVYKEFGHAHHVHIAHHRRGLRVFGHRADTAGAGIRPVRGSGSVLRLAFDDALPAGGHHAPGRRGPAAQHQGRRRIGEQGPNGRPPGDGPVYCWETDNPAGLVHRAGHRGHPGYDEDIGQRQPSALVQVG